MSVVENSPWRTRRRRLAEHLNALLVASAAVDDGCIVQCCSMLSIAGASPSTNEHRGADSALYESVGGHNNVVLLSLVERLLEGAKRKAMTD